MQYHLTTDRIARYALCDNNRYLNTRPEYEDPLTVQMWRSVMMVLKWTSKNRVLRCLN